MNDVVDADAGDDNHQHPKEFFHLKGVHPLGAGRTGQSAGDASRCHQNQRDGAEGGDGSAADGSDQACSLREEDNVDGVLRRGFGIHGEEQEQRRDVDGAAADADKRGAHAKEQADEQGRKHILHMVRAERALFAHVNEHGDVQNGQADGLNQTKGAFAAETAADKLKQPLAQQTAPHRTDGKGSAGAKGQLNPVVSGPDQRGNGHGKDGAAGEKADGADGQDGKSIQNRLDDHAAAETGDRTEGGGSKTDQEQNDWHEQGFFRFSLEMEWVHLG